MPPQLKTLLPLFFLLICIFLIARYFLIPESFGKYGHYRANSMDEIASLPTHYVGKEACTDCHDEEAAKLASDLHTGLTCEVCHGPGSLHVDDQEKGILLKPGSRESCGTCHSLNPARRTVVINQIDIKSHHPEKENCIDCHNPHAVWELKE